MHGVWKSQFKKSHSTLRAKRAMFTFWVDKNQSKNAKNGLFLTSFWKSVDCGSTVLPDRSVFLRQKLVENAKNERNSNATFE